MAASIFICTHFRCRYIYIYIYIYITTLQRETREGAMHCNLHYSASKLRGNTVIVFLTTAIIIATDKVHGNGGSVRRTGLHLSLASVQPLSNGEGCCFKW